MTTHHRRLFMRAFALACHGKGAPACPMHKQRHDRCPRCTFDHARNTAIDAIKSGNVAAQGGARGPRVVKKRPLPPDARRRSGKTAPAVGGGF